MSRPKISRRTLIKEGVGWLFMIFVVIAFALLVFMKVLAPLKFSSAHDNSLGDLIADSRCICVCPRNLNTTTKLNFTVFVMEVDDPGNCKCEDILSQYQEQDKLCLRCECNYESRNAALIAMIVYGMLIITFGCMPPCAIVVCVYPFLTRRRTLANVNSSNHRPYGYTPLTQSQLSPTTSPTPSSNSNQRRERVRLQELSTTST